MGKQFGIPTLYAGCMFRSRLEAKWVAFFDILGWEWFYEPSDLNYHIPDFKLAFPSETLGASVKPIFEPDRLEEFGHTLRSAEWEGEWLVLGERVPLAERDGVPICGLVSQMALDKDGKRVAGTYDFGGAAIGLIGPSWLNGRGDGCTGKPHISLQHTHQSFSCYFCGRHPGGIVDSIQQGTLFHLWNIAGNAVQWNAQRGPVNPFRDRLPGPTFNANWQVSWGVF